MYDYRSTSNNSSATAQVADRGVTRAEKNYGRRLSINDVTDVGCFVNSMDSAFTMGGSLPCADPEPIEYEVTVHCAVVTVTLQSSSICSSV